MTDKPTPTDAELEALLLDKLPASKHYIRPVIEKMVAAMQAAIDKWGQPDQAAEPVALLRNTTDPQPHAVTNLKYRSAADAKAGVEYIPVFAAPPPDPAYSEACSLATALFKKHFAHLPDYASGQVVWGLCDSTAGVILQIDNMVAGLVQPPTTSPQADSVQEDACHTTPLGWRCTRKAGHEGPCAAVEYEDDKQFVERGMQRIRDAEDAARYSWLRRWKGQEHEPPFTVQHEIDGTLWGGDLDAAIDVAMNKGASHDR